MSYNPNNIFAKILRGEIPCDRVHENDHALAFRDINPQTPVHVLVIPKGAYADLTDFAANASAEEITGFVRAVGETAQMLGITDDGYRALTNIGEHGLQEVPHFHVHLFGGQPLGRMIKPPGK